jgi:hypothetical protein
MPAWVKVVLAMILIGMVLLLVGAMVAARWVRTRADNLKKQGEVLTAEAKAFGTGKPGEACVSESLTRLRACQGFICEAKAKVFLQKCLTAANQTPDVCTGVPPPTEILASARWQIESCQRRGWRDNQRCMRLLGGLQAHCAGG